MSKFIIQITGGYTGAVHQLDNRYDSREEAERMVAKLKELNPSIVGNTRQILEVKR